MPHLYAALVPPRSLVEEVQAIARQAAEATPPETILAPPPSSRWARLLGRSARTTAPPEPVETGTFPTFPRVDTVNLPVATFGSVTAGDTARIVRALGRTLAEHRRPTVWFAGAVASSPAPLREDDVLSASLAGDLKELGEIARAVPRAVEAVGFYVDRRVYRPVITIARTAGVPANVLERVHAAFEGFRGEPWQVSQLSLMKRVVAAGDRDSAEVERISIGEE